MDAKQFDYYQKLKLQIASWLETPASENFKWKNLIKYAPDLFHFVSTLAAANEIPIETRKRLAQAMAYFISPYDFLPEEEIGAAGYADDITVCAIILKDALPEIERKIWSKYWDCETDLENVIKEILNSSKEMLSEDLQEKIAKKFIKE